MHISAHAIKRCKERGFDHTRLEDDVERFWNTIRYSIHTKAFYIKANKLLIVLKNKTIITVYSRAKKDKLKDVGNKRDSIAIPRGLRQALLKYQVYDYGVTLQEFRDLKKYNIELIK